MGLTMSEVTDLVVVGAGPCGLAVGAAARHAGIRAILVEKGCITQSLADYPPYMTFFSSADRLEIEDLPFIVASGRPDRREALVYYRRVARHFQLDVRQYQKVVSLDATKEGFLVGTRARDGTEATLESRALVLATGSFHAPNLLGVPGEDLAKVTHYFSDPYPFFDQDVLVVGGGNSSVESSLELFRAGARVTMVHFAHDLDPGVKPWVVPDIRNRMERGEIQVHWGMRVAEIHHRSVMLRDEDTGRLRSIPNDWVFAMTGWHPDRDLPRSVGVEFDPATGAPHCEPRTMESNVPGVFIAGVIAAGDDANKIFIENGREHGRLIVRELVRRWGTAGSP